MYVGIKHGAVRYCCFVTQLLWTWRNFITLIYHSAFHWQESLKLMQHSVDIQNFSPG